MKKILGWLLPAVILLIVTACSKERAFSDRYEFDAEWA